MKLSVPSLWAGCFILPKFNSFNIRQFCACLYRHNYCRPNLIVCVSNNVTFFPKCFWSTFGWRLVESTDTNLWIWKANCIWIFLMNLFLTLLILSIEIHFILWILFYYVFSSYFGFHFFFRLLKVGA